MHILRPGLAGKSNEARRTGGHGPRFRPRLERLEARDVPATVLDPNLAVRTVVTGLTQPTGMAFLGTNDFLVLEKSTGQVQRVVNGVVQSTVLDLAVNFGSERGLLGIALHPNFPQTPHVYLYWTESTTGSDTNTLSQTSTLGNRVDRFIWNGSTLTPDMNIIRLRAIQQDADQPERGNHDGGVLQFGPDGKLYIYVGDVGRRGQMQNLPDGPGSLTAPAPGAIPQGNRADDQFGGPEPDDEHLTGVILRLNPDGTPPQDNPFFRAGPLMYGPGTEAAANLQKVFAYGIRNGFGMAFDPLSGNLWEAQNGDDSFSELNLVERGANLGWIQVMGPIARLSQFKQTETTPPFVGLQQVRWPATNIADSPNEALARLFRVFEGGNQFKATLAGSQEVPPVNSAGSGTLEAQLQSDGTLRFRLRATGPLTGVTQAHFHLGARGQNGPVVAFLFGLDPAGEDFVAGDTIGEGVLTDAQVNALGTFDGTVASLVQRMRQGRVYVNVHTLANPGGEVRGQVTVDGQPVSRYSDPEFSWRFEVAPGGIGFISGRALGPQYEGDLITGGATPALAGGQLFRFNLTGNRRNVGLDDPRLNDRVADNVAKFDITESESLLFGRDFGVVTYIQTGPNGNLYVVSFGTGAPGTGTVYEIFRVRGGGQGGGHGGGHGNGHGGGHGRGHGKHGDESDAAAARPANTGSTAKADTAFQLAAESQDLPALQTAQPSDNQDRTKTDRDVTTDLVRPAMDELNAKEAGGQTGSSAAWLGDLDDEDWSLVREEAFDFAEPIRV